MEISKIVKLKIFNTVNKKINLTVIMCYFLLMSISVFITVQFKINESVQTMNSKADTLIELSSLSLAEPIWNFNQTAVEAFSDSLLNDREVYSVKVLGSNKEELYSKVTKNSDLKNAEKIDFIGNIEKDSEILGTVEIIFSKYYFNIALRQMIISSAVQNLLAALIFSLIIFLVVRRITKPLHQLILMAEKISTGDYKSRVQVKSNDEVGILSNVFNKMAENILNTMNELNTKSDELKIYIENLKSMNNSVTEVSSELNGSSTDLAASSEELNANIEEISSYANLISNVVVNVFEKTENLTKESTKISNLSNTSMEIIEKTISKINNINKVFSDILNKVEQLQKSSSAIIKITRSISKISSQTNLIAINASIEAAQAGEAGKGFTVVATEIRKLSAETTAATSKINNHILSINNDINTTFSAASEGNIEITEGVKLTMETAEAVKNITDSITTNIIEIKDIESESKKAAEGVTNVAKSTEDFTKAIEQVVLSSTDLAKLVEKLYGMVKV